MVQVLQGCYNDCHMLLSSELVQMWKYLPVPGVCSVDCESLLFSRQIALQRTTENIKSRRFINIATLNYSVHQKLSTQLMAVATIAGMVYIIPTMVCICALVAIQCLHFLFAKPTPSLKPAAL